MGCDDFWIEECWCNLSEGNELYFHKLIDRIVEIYIDDAREEPGIPGALKELLLLLLC